MASQHPPREVLCRHGLRKQGALHQIEADFDGYGVGYDVEVPGIKRSVHVPAIDVVLGCI